MDLNPPVNLLPSLSNHPPVPSRSSCHDMCHTSLQPTTQQPRHLLSTTDQIVDRPQSSRPISHTDSIHVTYPAANLQMYNRALANPIRQRFHPPAERGICCEQLERCGTSKHVSNETGAVAREVHSIFWSQVNNEGLSIFKVQRLGRAGDILRDSYISGPPTISRMSVHAKIDPKMTYQSPALPGTLTFSAADSGWVPLNMPCSMLINRSSFPRWLKTVNCSPNPQKASSASAAVSSVAWMNLPAGSATVRLNLRSRSEACPSVNSRVHSTP